MFAVCRGSLAEGVGFGGGVGLVIVVGVPFAAVQELRVRIKRESVEKAKGRLRDNEIVGITGGKEWYLLDAERAMN